MFGLHAIDLLVLLAYLAGVTALGFLSLRKVKLVSDFIMPRRFGDMSRSTHRRCRSPTNWPTKLTLVETAIGDQVFAGYDTECVVTLPALRDVE